MSEENQGSDQSAPAKSQKVKNYITISVDLLESNYKKLEEYARGDRAKPDLKTEATDAEIKATAAKIFARGMKGVDVKKITRTVWS